RIASIVKPATSRTPRRTSTGWCRKGAEAPTTPICERFRQGLLTHGVLYRRHGSVPQRIGFNVQTMDLARRHKVLAGLAILTTLTLTACGPEEPVAVADAEGTVVGQSPVAKQESWTGTGAYLAGTV